MKRRTERIVESELSDAIASSEEQREDDILRLLRDCGPEGLREKHLFNRANAIEVMRRRMRIEDALIRGWEAGMLRVAGVSRGELEWEAVK